MRVVSRPISSVTNRTWRVPRDIDVEGNSFSPSEFGLMWSGFSWMRFFRNVLLIQIDVHRNGLGCVGSLELPIETDDEQGANRAPNESFYKIRHRNDEGPSPSADGFTIHLSTFQKHTSTSGRLILQFPNS